MPTTPDELCISMADITRAAERIAPFAVRTPLLESPLLNDRLGARILLKAEGLQRTGSFKFRGALNKLASLSDAARRAGVVAFSSGNHGQGVAAAARLLRMEAVIVMPDDAPRMKIENTRAHGAEIVLYDRKVEDRAEIARRLASERGLVLVPPYDDPFVIAGQGTIGLELTEQAKEAGATLDDVLSPAGGGGLIGGLATAVKATSPATAIWSVEPACFDDTRRSLVAGQRLRNEAGHTTICDSLLTEQPGALTFPINQAYLTGGLAVTDTQAAAAMAAAMAYFKLVLEPGGAVALAALEQLPIAGKTVAVIGSGANIDPAHYAELLRGAPALGGR